MFVLLGLVSFGVAEIHSGQIFEIAEPSEAQG